MGVKAESEKEFQKVVINAARRLGWKVVEFKKVLVQRRNGTTYWATPFGADGKGFVDLLLAKPPRLLAWELKVPGNKPEPEQEEWLAVMAACGAETAVLYPRDWPAIEEALKR